MIDIVIMTIKMADPEPIAQISLSWIGVAAKRMDMLFLAFYDQHWINQANIESING